MERNQAGGGWPRTRNRAKGAALGRRRKELQLTQEELTQKLKLRGVRPLYLWEEGRAWPDPAMTRRLEKALYVEAGFFALIDTGSSYEDAFVSTITP